MLRISLVLSAIIVAVVNAVPVDVFVAGDGAPQYRIPALVRTGNGTLVAFAEARTEPSTDCGYKWIVARRSVDFGVTWGPLIDVVGREWTGWATGNVQPAWHQSSGRIVLTVGSKDLHAEGRGCQPGTAVFAVDDGGSDGAEWGPARNISADLSAAKGGPTLVPGPGSGVVLLITHPGRIVAVGVAGGAYSFDAVYWSDDAGLSWTASSHELGTGMDEANIAELSDGRLYLTMRNPDQTSCDCQAYSLSSDGGQSWGPILYDPILISPACEASVATFGGALYFANSASTTARANLTIRRTLPDAAPTDWLTTTHVVAHGITWGGYSSMARDAVTTNTGGILFERNITANTPDGNVISYDNFPLDF
jgi:sialidase-1